MDIARIKLKAVAAALRETEPDLVAELEYWRKNLPDHETRPASRAIVEAYVTRLETLLSNIRAGEEALRRRFAEYATTLQEIDELKTWLYREKRPIEAGRELVSDNQDVVGDWLGSFGMSYSQTSAMLRGAKHLKLGAPTSQRADTLKALDIQLSEKLSSSDLAVKLCNCGATEHGELCRDRFRKRIDLLENMMSTYKIKV